MVLTPPNCCLCGVALQPWYPGANGYGHNPDPLGENEDDRCCDDCNATKVIPARLGRMRPRRSRYGWGGHL